MVLVIGEAKPISSSFGRADWGPATVDGTGDGLAVSVPGGEPVRITFRGLNRELAAAGPLTYLRQGTPILRAGARVATARAGNWSSRNLVKPGRIRIEGEASEFVTPGLRLKGHLLPQRMTLADDEGKLVWSRALSGMLNLRTGPLLLVPPKVSPRAQPEHIALWLAAWLMFESAY